MLDKLIIFLLKNKLKGGGLLSKLFNRHDVAVENQYGVHMKLDPCEYVEKEIIVNGYYETEVLDLLMHAIETSKTKSVFWDIGANVGLHAMTIKKLYPEVISCTFEPYYYNFRKLAINLSCNYDIKIKKFSFGLSNDSEVNRMYTSEGNSGRTSFLEIEGAIDSTVNTLSCTGDFVVEQGLAPRPTIIKMDVEGWELNVLKGCTDILDNPELHTIIFEGPNKMAKTEVVPFLEAHGFNIAPIKRTSHIEETTENYIALRPVSVVKASHHINKTAASNN